MNNSALDRASVVGGGPPVSGRRARNGVVLLVLGMALGATAWRVTRPPVRPAAIDAVPAVAVDGAPSTQPISESEQRDRNIALFRGAVQQDPASAQFHAQLALQYMQRSRENASVSDVTLAEREARASLALRTGNNGAAFATLVESLLEQHRFGEAGRVARQLVAGNPDVAVYSAMLGEVELELGNYEAAGRAFEAVARDRTSFGVVTRLARLAEIRGDTARARAALYRAAAAAQMDGTMPSEQRAWFQLRVGDYELRHGALTAADSAFRRGLAASPDDHRLLSAMARLRAVQQNWRSAIDYGDQAIAQTLDPATLGLVSDAYAALGDSTKAAEYGRAMEVAVTGERGAYHRAWSLFLLDHDRRVAEVHANVRNELRTRRDIYGHDLLGWALYKRGRYGAARVELARAMAQGTQDALIFYHAGMIERASGDVIRASELLRRALAVNPYFDPLHPAAARATLDSIARESATAR